MEGLLYGRLNAYFDWFTYTFILKKVILDVLGQDFLDKF